jgi:hypothetical protein
MLSPPWHGWNPCDSSLAAQEGWHVHHMDVKSAFLNDDLKEEVYVHQPSPGKEGKVFAYARHSTACDRHRGRGMPSWISRSRGWASCQARMRRSSIDGANGGNALLLGVYVNDLVITDAKDAEVATFKEEMKATFQTSGLGHLSYLRIEVHQGDYEITLRQTAYGLRQAHC